MATQDSWAHNSKKRQQYASAQTERSPDVSTCLGGTLVYATACTCVQCIAYHHDTRPIQVVLSIRRTFVVRQLIAEQ